MATLHECCSCGDPFTHEGVGRKPQRCRPCAAQRAGERRRINREAFEAANPGYQRLYRERNAARLKAYWRDRHAAKSAEIRVQRQQYYRDNVEAAKERMRRYLATPEGAAARRRAKAKRRLVERSTPAALTLTVKEWEAILSQHDHCCAYCGAPHEEQDHVVPLSKGGMHTADNVLPSCLPCNRSKGDRLLADWLPRRLAEMGIAS